MKERLLASDKGCYRIHSIEDDREDAWMKFTISFEVDKGDKSKRFLLTTKISNMAVDNPSFDLYAFISKQVENTVKTVMKRVKW